MSDQTLRGSTLRAAVGIIQILCGSFGILVEIVLYIKYGQYDWYRNLISSTGAQFALGSTNCLLLVMTGIWGLCSQKKIWVVIVNMVFNISSAVVSVVWGVALGFDTYHVWFYEVHNGYRDGILVLIMSFLDMTLLLNFLFSVTGASSTCTAFCVCDANEQAEEDTFDITAYRSLNDAKIALLSQPNNDHPCRTSLLPM